ncbi:MAG: RlmE family RNA methyltransferase [Deltaproteobacteria bacterium]|nr:RlmE family RNA methyltransferase [Deltaproteobacteria bacterium]
MYERKDTLYRRAKAEGLRSRAAFKLSELQRRLRLIRRGDAVVDLGAWPGGWLQVAAELVGAEGRVLGIDLVALAPLDDARVVILEVDAADPALPARAREILGRPADVVLSDMAPKLTGIAPRDAARGAELLETARCFATATLRPGGTLVAKTFGGPEMEAARTALRARFGRVRLVGLDATRKGSSELYIVATDHRA